MMAEVEGRASGALSPVVASAKALPEPIVALLATVPFQSAKDKAAAAAAAAAGGK